MGRPHTRCVGLSGSTTREYEAWKKSALASSHGGRVCRSRHSVSTTNSVCWCPRASTKPLAIATTTSRSSKTARLVAMLRQLDLPLAAIKELLACDPVDAAERIAAHWRKVESAHDARRELADYLVNRLSGKRSVMYEVATREIPERSVLCLKRNVDEQGAWALGKEFIAILRERPLPKMEGREGAMFSIFWGEVSADSDGPVEWCKPVPGVGREGACVALPGVELADRTRTSRGVRRATERRATDWPGWEPERALAARVGGVACLGGGAAASTLRIQLEDLGVRITYSRERAGH